MPAKNVLFSRFHSQVQRARQRAAQELARQQRELNLARARELSRVSRVSRGLGYQEEEE